MKYGLILSAKSVVGLTLGGVLYAAFFNFYLSTLSPLVKNPYYGLMIWVAVFILAMIAGLQLVFKLTSRWE